MSDDSKKGHEMVIVGAKPGVQTAITQSWGEPVVKSWKEPSEKPERCSIAGLSLPSKPCVFDAEHGGACSFTFPPSVIAERLGLTRNTRILIPCSGCGNGCHPISPLDCFCVTCHVLAQR